MTVAAAPSSGAREPEAATLETARRAVLFREIEQLLATGFTGQITLHCNQGRIPRYTIKQTRQPGKRR